MYHERDTYHRTRDGPIFLESKKKMTEKQNQPLNLSRPKKLTIHPTSTNNHNHHPHITLHTNTPTPVQNTSLITTDTLYQPHSCTPATSQSHTAQPTITYPLPPLQITYPITNTQTIHPKLEPNPLPPPPPQHPESSQQSTNLPTFRTIHTITRGSNLDFQNKR
jgi:hypothetical protein